MARRRVRDVVDKGVPRRRVRDVVYTAPEYWKSPYYNWAKQFFYDRLFVFDGFSVSVDDLLQQMYFKYRRCIELYVEGERSCKSGGHFMRIWQTVCNNYMRDYHRKRTRQPERYSSLPIASHAELDNTLLTIEEHASVSVFTLDLAAEDPIPELLKRKSRNQHVI